MKQRLTHRLHQEALKYQNHLASHIQTLTENGYISQLFDILFEICLSQQQHNNNHYEEKNNNNINNVSKHSNLLNSPSLQNHQDSTTNKKQQYQQKQSRDIRNINEASGAPLRGGAHSGDDCDENSLKENLKLILNMLVDDAWKSVDCQILQSKANACFLSQASLLSNKSHKSHKKANFNNQINTNKNAAQANQKNEQSIQLGGMQQQQQQQQQLLNRDFIEPPKSVNRSVAKYPTSKNNSIKYDMDAIDDSESEVNTTLMVVDDGEVGQDHFFEDKENIHGITNQSLVISRPAIFNYDGRNGGDIELQPIREAQSFTHNPTTTKNSSSGNNHQHHQHQHHKNSHRFEPIVTTTTSIELKNPSLRSKGPPVVITTIFEEEPNTNDSNYNHNNNNNNQNKESINTNNRRYTEQQTHHVKKFREESEFVYSQFQTPQYKQSEIGNPISSPQTDERQSSILVQQQQHQQQQQQQHQHQQQDQKVINAKNKLLSMNLLSQENSARDDFNKIRSRLASTTNAGAAAAGGSTSLGGSTRVNLFFKNTNQTKGDGFGGTNDDGKRLTTTSNEKEQRGRRAVGKRQEMEEDRHNRIDEDGEDTINFEDVNFEMNDDGSGGGVMRADQDNGIKEAQQQLYGVNPTTTTSGAQTEEVNERMAQIMMKNVWEIENNPMFSSGRGGEANNSITDDENMSLSPTGYERVFSHNNNNRNINTINSGEQAALLSGGSSAGAHTETNYLGGLSGSRGGALNNVQEELKQSKFRLGEAPCAMKENNGGAQQYFVDDHDEDEDDSYVDMHQEGATSAYSNTHSSNNSGQHNNNKSHQQQQQELSNSNDDSDEEIITTAANCIGVSTAAAIGDGMAQKSSTDYDGGSVGNATNSNMGSSTMLMIHTADNISESKAPVSSIEGPVSHVNYQQTQGVQKKINKLNLAQVNPYSSANSNMLFQMGTPEENTYRNNTQPLLMDLEYLKSVPKSGRDNYLTTSNSNFQHHQHQHHQHQPLPLHPQSYGVTISSNFGTTSQKQDSLIKAGAFTRSKYGGVHASHESNSLMLSSDQPTKLSPEEVIKNYTNANFMPQKQAADRLHLLCQSRELNPLISLSVETPDVEEATNMKEESTTYLGGVSKKKTATPKTVQGGVTRDGKLILSTGTSHSKEGGGKKKVKVAKNGADSNSGKANPTVVATTIATATGIVKGGAGGSKIPKYVTTNQQQNTNLAGMGATTTTTIMMNPNLNDTPGSRTMAATSGGSRSDSRSKTPLINRPASNNAGGSASAVSVKQNSRTQNNHHLQQQQQQQQQLQQQHHFYTTQQIYSQSSMKRDDSENDSKFLQLSQTQHHLNINGTLSKAGDILSDDAKKRRRVVQQEGQKIANKLAKAIKGKAGGASASNSGSRNQPRIQSNTAPLVANYHSSGSGVTSSITNNVNNVLSSNVNSQFNTQRVAGSATTTTTTTTTNNNNNGNNLASGAARGSGITHNISQSELINNLSQNLNQHDATNTLRVVDQSTMNKQYLTGKEAIDTRENNNNNNSKTQFTVAGLTQQNSGGTHGTIQISCVSSSIQNTPSLANNFSTSQTFNPLPQQQQQQPFSKTSLGFNSGAQVNSTPSLLPSKFTFLPQSTQPTTTNSATAIAASGGASGLAKIQQLNTGQRNESSQQVGFRTTNSTGANQGNPNKFSLRRFTTNPTEDTSPLQQHQPFNGVQQPPQTQRMQPTQQQQQQQQQISGLMGLGQSLSTKNFIHGGSNGISSHMGQQQPSAYSSMMMMQPSQRPSIGTVYSQSQQAIMSPSQAVKQVRRHIDLSAAAQFINNHNNIGSGTNAGGNTKTLKEVSSHKNIMSGVVATQPQQQQQQQHTHTK